MKAAILTPTCRYGGFDVVYNSLLRQTETEIGWVIGDDLYHERKQAVAERVGTGGIPTIHFLPREKPAGYFSDLAGIYNQMADMAVKVFDPEVLISVQDFIWLPSDGVERFIKDLEQKPDDLISGICSHSLDPHPEDVKDLKGLWSIFDQDYEGPPVEEGWRDCRLDMHQGLSYADRQHWELNWAAWPASMFKQGVRFDEEYGKGIAYENQAYAWDAYFKLGSEVWVDADNISWSLPHKKYWPEQEVVGLPHALSNQELHLKKYSSAINAVGGQA